MTELRGEVERRVAEARRRIAAVTTRPVEVVAVTKRFTAEHAAAAVAAGCEYLGENYAQEAVGKWPAQQPPAPLQFIGQLQTNKIRLLTGLVTVFATVDRRAIVTELAKRAPGARVLLQVDTTAEPGKGGCLLDEVPELSAFAADAGLQVDGLMTVGPTSGGPEDARGGFRAVRALADRLGVEHCSMGMSLDLEVAVAEGATQVRLGTALFGARSPLPHPGDQVR